MITECPHQPGEYGKVSAPITAQESLSNAARAWSGASQRPYCSTLKHSISEWPLGKQRQHWICACGNALLDVWNLTAQMCICPSWYHVVQSVCGGFMWQDTYIFSDWQIGELHNVIVWQGVACGDTEPDRATNEFTHVSVLHMYT